MYCTSLGESPTARWRRWRARSPPRRPQTAKQFPAVFFLPSFFFWAYMGKRKSGGRSDETQCGYCLRAEFTLASPAGRGGSRSETERDFCPLSPASRELPLRGSLSLTAAHPSVCHPERSRSFGEGVSRCAATIRSKTEERKRRRDLVRTLAILPNDVTFLTGR